MMKNNKIVFGWKKISQLTSVNKKFKLHTYWSEHIRNEAIWQSHRLKLQGMNSLVAVVNCSLHLTRTTYLLNGPIDESKTIF